MDKLNNILINYIGQSEKNVFFETSFIAANLSFKKIGEILMGESKIIEELPEENIYIVSVKILFNPATAAIEVKDGQINIVAAAREGLIKQHTAKKAVDKIKSAIAGK